MNCLLSCRLLTFLILWLLFFLTLFPNMSIFAQHQTVANEKSSGYIVIQRIAISGNAITRDAIILRELKFKQHDTISVDLFAPILNSSRQNIFNTRLFNFVTIDTAGTANSPLIDINIKLVERWYIWPIPFLEISDRNFNVWWETRDFSRLTYGVDFTFFNARGRNETLKILAHFGFNQKYGFTYKMPFINKKKTIGVFYGAAIELNHELPVTTENNKPVYVRSNSFYLKKMLNGFAELNVRPDFYSTHSFRISYSWYRFDTAIMSIPGFVLSSQDLQQFMSFSYQYKNDHRDVQYYPLKGYYLDAEVNHAVPYATAHNSYLKTNMRIYAPIRNRWYWASGFTGKVSFEKTQPYYLQRGLGYGRDFVRGYEYYVIDGQHYFLFKNNLKFALLPQRVEKIPFLKSSKFNVIPIALYLNAFIDMGLVYNYHELTSGDSGSENNLENSFLIGSGLGLDFTTYYDVVIRVEGTINRMLIPGIYLHFIAPI